jgi:hypothetical protein
MTTAVIILYTHAYILLCRYAGGLLLYLCFATPLLRADHNLVKKEKGIVVIEIIKSNKS